MTTTVDLKWELSGLYSAGSAPAFVEVPDLPYLMIDGAPVMPLEGLWWMPDMAAFATAPRSGWDWTMMIVQPARATAELVADARATEARATEARKKGPAAIDRVELRRYERGHCALRGKHHEICLGDPRRTAPEKLRTIIRQPVARA